jgi:NAD(P)H-dependent FMN reductase
MKLIIFRGSPRGAVSNSQVLIDRFTDGLKRAGKEEPQVFDLKAVRHHDEYVAAMADADQALFFFPLYTDCMPGIVMAFFEALAGFSPVEGRPHVGFVVQSGFLESVHSLALERYLEKLARRLGTRYLGTVIRGGGEGLKEHGAFGYEEVVQAFTSLGEHFGRTGEFDPAIVESLRRLKKLPLPLRLLFNLTRFTDIGWNKQMKGNGVFGERHARPYV